MRFLSDEWLAALDRAARTLEVDPNVSIVIEQTVRTEEGDVVWHTRVDDGTIQVGSGSAPEAIQVGSGSAPEAIIVRMSSDAGTAWQIASGRLSAQRAFLDGRLILSGDVRSLMAVRSALDAIADAFSGVRADTDAPA